MVNNLGLLLMTQGRLTEAEPYLGEALAGRRHVLGEDHPDTMRTILNMALLFLDQDKLAEAESIYRGVLEKRAVLADSQIIIAEALLGIGEILNLTGRYADAEPLIREGLAISRKAIAPSAYEISLATSVLGEALAGQKQFGEAEPLVIKGSESLIASPRTTERGKRRAIERVIKFYTDWDKPEKAAKMEALLRSIEINR